VNLLEIEHWLSLVLDDLDAMLSVVHGDNASRYRGPHQAGATLGRQNTHEAGNAFLHV